MPGIIEIGLWVWAAASLLQFVGVYWLSWRSLGLAPRYEPRDGRPRGRPRVHVVVPARNEERDVEGCLRSLSAQDWPELRVLLVDDGSTDATAEIARSLAAADPRLEVIEAGPLPEGWVGKPHALYEGWRHLRPDPGDLLLFTDADIELAPQAVREALALIEEEEADLLSLMPRLVNRGFWERTLQPAVAGFLALAGVAGSLRRGKDEIRPAAGAFLLIRADAYRRAGGHRGVRDQIIEDVALATHVHHRGGRTVARYAPRLLKVRMYRGFREIWRGWSKNAFAGHRNRLGWALASVAFLVAFWAAPPVLAAACALAGEPALGVAFLLSVILGLVWRAAASASLREPIAYALTLPAAALVITGILGWSIVQARLLGGASWRGRRYPVG